MKPNNFLNFHKYKLYFCKQNANEFYTQLKEVVLNNLPIETIQFENDTFNNNYISLTNQLNMTITEVEEIYGKYNDIINYLRGNRSIEYSRLQEIFSIWIYWIIGFNEKIISGIQKILQCERHLLNFYSFSCLISMVERIFINPNNITFLFRYVNKNCKQTCDNTNENDIERIYDDMTNQPDAFTRCVCSQSLQNLRLIYEYDYKLDRKKIYDHPILKTPLEWAFYCDNIAIYRYIIHNGYKISENGIFFNLSLKKNFKFLFYLYILKNYKPKLYSILNESMFDSFDEETMIDANKFYEMLEENEIIDILEFMFKNGFDLIQTSRIFGLINKDDPTQIEAFKSNMRLKLEDMNDYKYSQLAICICQPGIRPSIIKYVLDKFKNTYCIDADTLQDELAKILILSSKIYHKRVFRKKFKVTNHRIRAYDMINIFETILPMLNLDGVRKFKLMLNDFKYDLYQFYMLTFFSEVAAVTWHNELIENEKNYPFYLYDRKSFKVIDIFINYNLLDKNDLLLILKTTYLHDINRLESIEPKMKTFGLFIYYLVDNRLIDTDEFLNWLKVVTFKDLNLLNHQCEVINEMFIKNVQIIAKLSRKKCKESKKMESLVDLCLHEIKKHIISTTADCLNNLKLPKSILNLFIETTKTKKKKVEFKINYHYPLTIEKININ